MASENKRNADSAGAGRESALAGPVKAWLEAGGHEVRSEVGDCDLLARIGDELVAVELKLRLNLEVILQAVDRQRIADRVFVAVPDRGREDRTGRMRRILGMLKRLEIGLLRVTPAGQVRMDLEGLPFDRARSVRSNRGRRVRLLKEFDARHGDRNTGGVRGQRIMTAYREQALLLAHLLDRDGPATAAALRRLGAGDKAHAILYKNHYGWFDREGAGRYGLNDKGKAELARLRPSLDWLPKDD